MKPLRHIIEMEPKDNKRRILKPIIEKRRRERINSHLEELKNLVCGNTRSKLEKADILELTVNHLRKLIAAQRRSLPNSTNTPSPANPQKPAMDPTRAGYIPSPQELQRLMVKNANDNRNVLAAQQRLHLQQQRLSMSSPSSSCSSLSPSSPTQQPFVLLPMMHQCPSHMPPASISLVQLDDPKSDVWRPW